MVQSQRCPLYDILIVMVILFKCHLFWTSWLLSRKHVSIHISVSFNTIYLWRNQYNLGLQKNLRKVGCCRYVFIMQEPLLIPALYCNKKITAFLPEGLYQLFTMLQILYSSRILKKKGKFSKLAKIF